MKRPDVGEQYWLALGANLERVTVVPTGRGVPADEVNVMRPSGSIITVRISRLDFVFTSPVES